MPRASRKKRNQPPTRGGEQHREQTLVQVQHSSWEGPLPSPATLAEFDRIVPGAAERIINEWQSEANHRRTFERKALTIEGLERIGGRVLAFVFAIAALATAIYLAVVGAEWAASIIGGGTIASVVASMVYSRRR